MIAGLTKTAVRLGLGAVPPEDMIRHLQSVSAIEDLHSVVRSFYSGPFKTWEIREEGRH